MTRPAARKKLSDASQSSARYLWAIPCGESPLELRHLEQIGTFRGCVPNFGRGSGTGAFSPDKAKTRWCDFRHR